MNPVFTVVLPENIRPIMEKWFVLGDTKPKQIALAAYKNKDLEGWKICEVFEQDHQFASIEINDGL